MRRMIGRAACAAIACAASVGLVAAPVGAEAVVGVDAGFGVGGNSFDIGFEQVLQTALDSQFVGIDVAVDHGRLILDGYASPGVHTAVLAILANLLQNPIPVPVALSVVSPNLGLGALHLPLLDAGAAVALPDLSGLIHLLGVVDRIRIAR